jgi:predicted nucleic acid-binding protein
MRPLSCLSEASELLVADTSVAINLNATGCAARVMAALPYRIVIVDSVQAELEYGRQRGRNDADRTAALVAAGHLKIVQLGENALDVFGGLVVGSAAETLDDGEAATLAHAVETSGVAVIDERKALRIAAVRYPKLVTASTMDLLGHPCVCDALGEGALADALFFALRDARMRIFPPHTEWAVKLIGAERAAQCPSLKSAPAAIRAK